MKAIYLLSALLIIVSQVVSANDDKPNFLIVSIDDLKSTVGYLSEEPGNFLSVIYPEKSTRDEIRRILTPNIDRLASESSVFSDAHTIYPICNPSRIALWTGTRPIDTGFVTNSFASFRTHPNGVNLITLQQNLRDNGYFTTGLGKVYHSPRGGTDEDYSWDIWVDREHGAKGPWEHSVYSNGSFRFQFGTSPFTLDEQWDIENADHAARLMATGTSEIVEFGSQRETTVSLPTGKPFLVSVGIYLPHVPFVAPREILDLFDVSDMQLDREALEEVFSDLDDLSDGGRFYATTNTSATSFAGYFSEILKYGLRVSGPDGDLAAWRELVRHYLASIVVADRAVGRLLDALDNGPYADNTIVALHTDHGYYLGEKNVLGKNVLWTEATRSVLMIRIPDQNGSVIDETVHLQDLYPTINSLAGIMTPPYVTYRDLSPLMDSESAVSTRPILVSQGAVNAKRFAVVTERYLYLRFGGLPGNAELYDRYVDPELRVNLINNPDYQSLGGALDRVMEQLLTNDDAPPVISSMPVQRVNLEVPVYQSVIAWHVLGDSLNYMATDLPPGLSLDPASGKLQGIPNAEGHFSSLVTVSSSEYSSTISLDWLVEPAPVVDTDVPAWQSFDSIKILNVTSNSVHLDWDEASDNIGISSYRIYLIQEFITDTPESSVILDGLNEETAYEVEIIASDSAGNITEFPLETTTLTSSSPPVYFTTLASSGVVGLEKYADDASVYRWSTQDSHSIVFQGRSPFPTVADIDAISMVSDNQFFASFNTAFTLEGVGRVQDKDLLYYDDGEWSLYQIGRELGLTHAGHDIDAISVNGNVIYFSVASSINIPDVGLVDDADVLRWNGVEIVKAWDASENGLIGSADIVGLHAIADDHYYFTFSASKTNIPVVGNVRDVDIVEFNRGQWLLYLDGASIGLSQSGHDIDGFSVGFTEIPTPDQVNPYWIDTQIFANDITDRTVSLDWADANDNVAIKGYQVNYVVDGQEFTIDTSSSFSVINQLVPGTGFRFEVYAVDSSGNVSLSPLIVEAITTEVTPPSDDRTGLILFSILGNNSIDGVDINGDDADLYFWSTDGFDAEFDASMNGLSFGVDTDAVSYLGEGRYLLSFLSNSQVPGLGLIEDEDVLEYDNGTWSVFFDATKQRFTSGAHDIDAVSYSNNLLYFSTSGSGPVSTLGSPDDADIYSWDGAKFGRVFDGTANGLPGNADVDALSVLADGHYLFSFNATKTRLPGIGDVEDEDIVEFNNGVWSLYFDGTENDLTAGGHDLDAISLYASH